MPTPEPNITIEDVRKALQSAIAAEGGKQITLNKKLFPAVGTLTDLLKGADVKDPSKLVVRQDDKTKTLLLVPGTGDQSPVLTGISELFVDTKQAPTCLVSVVFSVKDGKLQLEFDAHPRDPNHWEFTDSFSKMPPFETWDGTELAEQPSFFNEKLVFTGVEFEVVIGGSANEELTFRANADLDKSGVDKVKDDMPGKASLELAGNPSGLTGTIKVRRNTFPEVTLSGTFQDPYKADRLDIPVTITGISLRTEGDDLKAGRSKIFLFAKSHFSDDKSDFDIETLALQQSFDWRSTGKPNPDPLDRILAKLTKYVGGTTLPIPAGVTVGDFTLDEILLTIQKGAKTKSEAIKTIGLRVSAFKESRWDAPIFGFGLSRLAITWDVDKPFVAATMSGSFSGRLLLTRETTPPWLDVKLEITGNKPLARELKFSAKLPVQTDPKEPPPEVKLAQLFRAFAGLDLGIDTVIAALTLSGNTGPRTLHFDATLKTEDPFGIKAIRLSEASFAFDYAPNLVTGTLNATAHIGKLIFNAIITYLGQDDDWEFALDVRPGYTLQQFVEAALGSDFGKLPAGLGDLGITKLHLAYTKNADHFAFQGAMVWPFHELGLDVRIDAEVYFESTGLPSQSTTKTPGSYSGYVRGALTLNNFRFSAVYTFAIAKNPSIGYEFQYNDAVLTLTHNKPANLKEKGTLTARLTGVSFGDILDYLVHIARPSAHFTLPDPWSALYSLSFDHLIFTADLDTEAVGIAYPVNTNLGFIDIRTLGLNYKKKGGRGTVVLTFTGTFFGKKYGDDEPDLNWDMLNDKPPATPGNGEQKFDLRYAGIGQNVGFRSTHEFVNVTGVLAQMAKDFQPAPDDDAENPLAGHQLSALRFTGDGGSLIAADFTIMEAVTIGIVFSDSASLYGLHVGLSGKRVGRLAGLDFDLLYRRVSDTIGVYHIELTLPQAFRQFDLGAVSITVPVIILDIFTNGDFRVNLGYPKGTDFTASFCLQAGPLIGYGGLYFAKLDGAASDRVPRITNGTFSTVIEAGLALSAGIGRSVDKGVFKATATLTVQGSLQGVFGWFTPNDSAVGTATFYWIQGTVAVVGKLSGSIDFSVISISVSLQLSAAVTLTIEAYKAASLLCEFNVTASASIKVLFIRISFSFSTTLSLSFNIGSDSTPPWILAPTPAPDKLLRQSAWRQPQLSAAALQRFLVAALGEQAGTFDWKPQPVFPGQTLPLVLAASIVPALTVASPQKVAATAALVHGTESLAGELQAVFSLFLRNSVATSARTAADALTVEAPEQNTAPMAFNLLCEGLLRWALLSYQRNSLIAGGGQTLTTDLDAIGAFLADEKLRRDVFQYDRLAELMRLNFDLRISSALGQPDTEESHTVFPMAPELSVQFGDLARRDYKTYNCVSAEWQDALSAYYAQLRPASPPRRLAEAGPMGTAEAAAESLTTVLFRDYFALVTRGAVESAKDLLAAYPYVVDAANNRSLEQIAKEFNGPKLHYYSRRGDSLGLIAASLGLDPADLHTGNARLTATDPATPLTEGTEVRVSGPVTVGSIAEANANYPLLPGAMLPITGVSHTIRPGASGPTEPLDAIYRQYGFNGTLPLFERDGKPNTNAVATNLLQPGVTLHIPAFHATLFAVDKDNTDLVAAFYFVRNLGPELLKDQRWADLVNWYATWIAAHNTLPAPTWCIPLAKPGIDVPIFDDEQTYTPQGAAETSLAPDTVELVAAYCAMLQLKPAPYTDKFQEFKASVHRLSGDVYQVPAFDHVIRAGESLKDIASMFGVSLAHLLGEEANIKMQGLLRPLATLAVPSFDFPARTADTLQTVASRFNLTVPQLALSVKEQPGILVPSPGPTGLRLTIPDVPARDPDTLVGDLSRFGRFNNIAGMVSNFMLHGMRVPSPTASLSGGCFPPDTKLWGLYEMAGHQFPVPTGPSAPTGVVAVLQANSLANWIHLENAGPSGIAIGLTARYLDTAPARTLTPDIVEGPTGLPLWVDAASRYPLAQNIPWQSPAPPSVPGPTWNAPQTGHPTLWPFPPNLLDVARCPERGPTASSFPYRLRLKPNSREAASETDISLFQWAMAVDFRIQRVPSPTGVMLPDTYAVLGADQNGRAQLLRAWTYLEQSRPGSSLYLLYRPSGAGRNSAGLASSLLDPALTFLLKANLSTITRSNQQLLRTGAPTYKYSAALSDPAGFLKLVWEASVTGSGGFYLSCSGKGSQALPEDLFAEGDTATLTLLLLEASQSAPTGTERGLLPLNNCALTGENIDPASFSLAAEPLEPSASQLQRRSIAPPGYAGFSLARRNPQPPGSTASLSPEDQTRALFNLTSFSIAETYAFSASNEALPVGPVETPPLGISGPSGSDVWWYHQLVPVAQFGKTNQTPSSLALPNAKANPYAGPTAKLETLQFKMDFNDLFGNHLSPSGPGPSASVLVGYSDELIGPAGWPGAGMDFLFQPGPSGSVELEAEVSFQTDRYVPSGDSGFNQTHAASVADAARYAQIFYQIQQQDTRIDLQTNLGEVALPPASVKASLSAFVSKASVFTNAASTLEEHTYTSVADDTLDKVAATFNVTSEALLGNNLDLRVNDLLVGTIVQPHFATATPSDTLDLLAKQSRLARRLLVNASAGDWIHGLRMVSMGAPEPQSPLLASTVDGSANQSAVSVADLAANNLHAPLTPGVVLLADGATLSSGAVAGDTLRSIAVRLGCAVFGPSVDANPSSGLYAANQTTPGIVKPNLEITIGNRTVNTGPEPTLESVRKQLVDASSEPDSFERLQDVRDLLLSDARLSVDTFIVPAPAAGAAPTFSLAELPPRCGNPVKFAEKNAFVQNFFLAGTPIFLYKSDAPAPMQFDTFASFCSTLYITPAQFAAFNGAASCKANATLRIPGLLRLPLPDRANLFASVSPAADDKLEDLIFTVSPQDRQKAVQKIAELNSQLPSFFADGCVVEIPKGIQKPQPEHSLHLIAGRFEMEDAAFLEAISQIPGLLRAGGAILIPLPSIPADAGNSLSWNAIAARFRIASVEGRPPAVHLLEANRCLEGFLRVGAEIKSTDPAKPITVRPFDTVATVLRRFETRDDLRLTMDQLVEHNGNCPALLTPDARFLIPPGPATLRSTITPKLPPKIASQSPADQSIVFPVTVSLLYIREKNLVLNEFSNTPAVYQALALLTPRGWASKSTPMDSFAARFEDAFAASRLKAAVSEPHPDEAHSSRSLWAVNFGDTGIRTLKLDATNPNFFALTPLSRQLLGGTVTVHSYVSGIGLCGEQTLARTYNDVDLDVWMRQFFATIDLVLSAAYATPAYQLRKRSTSAPGMAAEASGPSSFMLEAGPAGISALEAPSLPSAGCSGMAPLDGPANLESIIGGKLAIAGELRNYVQPVLDGVGPSGPQYTGAAQELLYQQMLGELSSAYNINAVVQFPVGVSGPGGDFGPTATPRLAGTITTDLKTVPQAGTLSAAAEPFAISPAYLARLLEGVQGLLRTSAKVIYKDKTLTIQPNQTLADLAALFGLFQPGPPTWSTWTEWVKAIAGQPILVPEASLPLVKVERLVPAGPPPEEKTATLEQMASFFGVPSLDIVQANQDRPGILKAGSKFTIGAKTYSTTGLESLSDIAREFTPPAEIKTLLDIIVSCGIPLTPRFNIGFAQLLPEVTLSNAKLALGSLGAGAKDTSALTFVISLKRPANSRKIFLNLRYIANEAEYAIRTVEDAGGYQSSSWLTLLRPIGDGGPGDFGIELAMPQVQVPVPLRSFPTPLTLVAQSGEATDAKLPEPSTPQEAIRQSRLWDYQFDIVQSNAAQDASHLEVTFNADAPQDSLLRASGDRTRLLFAALAQFIDIYPALIEDLSRLPHHQPGQPDPAAAGAIAALDTITQSVVAALRAPSLLFAANPKEEVFRYSTELTTGADKLRLILNQGQGKTGPLWPQISVGATGLTFQQLSPVKIDDLSTGYDYPDGYVQPSPETQRFRFPQRDVLRQWNGWGGAQLTRNDRLIASGPVGYAGPTAAPPLAPISTAAAFLYATPMARFVDLITPFLWNSNPIDITNLRPTSEQITLEKYFKLLFDAVFSWESADPALPQKRRPISMDGSYSFPVGEPGSGVFVTMPIFLLPMRAVGQDETDALAKLLNDTIHAWSGWAATQPDGLLVFDVTLYTANGQQSDYKPILRLEKLTLPISAIKK